MALEHNRIMTKTRTLAGLAMAALLVTSCTGLAATPSNSTTSKPSPTSSTAAAAAPSAGAAPADSDRTETTALPSVPSASDAATAFACALAAHPSGETPDGLVKRLSTLASGELVDAVMNTQLLNAGGMTIEAWPGAVDDLGGGVFVTRCSTRTLSSTGSLVRGPDLVVTVVTVTKLHGRWLATNATVNGVDLIGTP